MTSSEGINASGRVQKLVNGEAALGVTGGQQNPEQGNAAGLRIPAAEIFKNTYPSNKTYASNSRI